MNYRHYVRRPDQQVFSVLTGASHDLASTLINYDFSAFRSFRIREAVRIEFRSEFYNLFGADNFYNPVSLFSTDGFTQNPDFGKIKSAHDPRQIQFAVRFNW